MNIGRRLAKFGFHEDTYLLVLAFVIGVLTAVAAIIFHQAIEQLRKLLYEQMAPDKLYGSYLWLLLVLPTIGGLAVGLFMRYIIRLRPGGGGGGLVDIIQNVSRTGGVIDPRLAVERLVSSSILIGSGGSAGAETPIVQIGAGIASGIGQLFRVTRAQMPILIGCGSAAGISAIFNAPIGGVLFTLEVVLRDFSIRTFTPVVVASVIANFAMQSLFQSIFGHGYNALFALPELHTLNFRFSELHYFVLLGILCGVIGVIVVRLMLFFHKFFHKINFWHPIRPAIGGAMLGVLGIAYIVLVWQTGATKFIPFDLYAMPAFFGDGYGAVKPMLRAEFYTQPGFSTLILFGILSLIVLFKVFGTCFTLASSEAGGIIAPSLFMGAVTGAAFGMMLQMAHLSAELDPNAYALVGMGAVLASVIHAPLAAILITFEVTHDPQVILPSMLACIIATTMSQIIFGDSLYSAMLKRRGVRIGHGGLAILSRLTVEQVDLEPATIVREADPFQHVLDLTTQLDVTDFVVVNRQGMYTGMITAADVRAALLDRDAVPLLTVSELERSNVLTVHNASSLSEVLDIFGRYDLSCLPVTLSHDNAHVIGLISRTALMRRYQQQLNNS